MKTLPEKLIAIIETALDDFPKIEPVMINRKNKDQEIKILIGVQRIENFQTLFNISMSIAPRGATVVFTKLTECVDPDVKVNSEQHQTDEVNVNFDNNEGVQEIRNNITKRLTRGSFEDTIFSGSKNEIYTKKSDEPFNVPQLEVFL